MLYLIRSGNYIKIGFTEDLDSRISQYETHNPNFEVIGIKDGNRADELEYHLYLNKLGLSVKNKVEWFFYNSDVIKELSKSFNVSYDRDTVKNKKLLEKETILEALELENISKVSGNKKKPLLGYYLNEENSFIRFESIKQAARVLKVTPVSIRYNILHGYRTKGVLLKFE